MGLGVVDSEEDGLTLVHSDVLSPPRSRPLSDRLHYLHSHLVDAIGRWEPTVLAVEEPFVARNVRAAMAVGQAQAVAMVAAAQHGLSVYSYAPSSVKLAVTDSGASSKEQVQEMVSILLRISEETEQSLDASDALAVAICHTSHARLQSIEALR